MIMIIQFILNISSFSIVCFLTKLLMSGILFSTLLIKIFVAKLLMSGILFSNSGILVL